MIQTIFESISFLKVITSVTMERVSIWMLITMIIDHILYL